MLSRHYTEAAQRFRLHPRSVQGGVKQGLSSNGLGQAAHAPQSWSFKRLNEGSVAISPMGVRQRPYESARWQHGLVSARDFYESSKSLMATSLRHGWCVFLFSALLLMTQTCRTRSLCQPCSRSMLEHDLILEILRGKP